MGNYKGVVAVGLLALALTAGCGDDSCEITCADGYKTEAPFGCGNGELANELAKDHGGSCTGK
jgi:hypothetical protein